ncbi:hypothetical protein SF123566_5487 [Shigella flexneri 1235-66]|nr:hypothetical protein SF123566_5487 [Shigella flexneri 1235-66]
MLFAPGHTCRCTAKLGRASKADFNKYGGVAFTHYQVDFAATLTHVGGDKMQSLALQPVTRGGFPRVTGLFTC